MSASPDVPESLTEAQAAVPEVRGFSFTGPWRRFDGTWSIPAEVHLPDAQSSPHMRLKTAWWIVADENASGFSVYPAKDGGISATFAHQLRNDPGKTGIPWRKGKVCLDAEGFRLGRKNPELAGQSPAMLAGVVPRLVAWAEGALTNTLTIKGDRYELPDFSPIAEHFCFQHEDDDAPYWAARPGHYGTMSTSRTGDIHWLVEFSHSNGKHLYSPPWGDHVPESDPTVGTWLMLPQEPIEAPMQTPASWDELARLCKKMGIDLAQVLAHHVRKANPDGLLALGFPVPRNRGDAAHHIHWQACKVPVAPSGRGPNMAARLHLTRLSSQRRSLQWLASTNWHPAEVHARGGLVASLRDRRILLVGCGSLGSNIADLLVRGGATRLTLVDADNFETWNLVRHELDLRDVGKNKAKALAATLRQRNPSARIQAFAQGLREVPVGMVIQHDVIIDCTAQDSVLGTLSLAYWPQDAVFASFSITARANRLFSFIVHDRNFPRFEFEATWQVMKQGKLDPLPTGGPTGCWHPVFEGAWHRISQLAAMAVQEMERYVAEGRRGPLATWLDAHVRQVPA